jgi:uncharacterized membrane protein
MSLSLNPPSAAPPSTRGPLDLWRELLQRQRTLVLFALFMALATLPTLVAMGLDERLFRGVSIWAKPLKFMISLCVFSLSTAWFIGLLPLQQRQTRAVRLVVWTIVIAGVAEVAYISLQAALGQASHYNVSDRFHVVMYQLMGVGALSLMLTQLVLARQIARHARPELHPAWKQAVVLGLVMTFVLGVGAAALLSSAQPPAGPGLPLLGWHLGGGDLRPAHFIGSHAQQLVPLAGALFLRGWPTRARLLLWVFAAGYTALWLLALLRGLSGAVWLPPPV